MEAVAKYGYGTWRNIAGPRAFGQRTSDRRYPHYMAERLRAFERFKRHTVAPLVLLPISELEDLEGHLPERGLALFLKSFWRNETESCGRLSNESSFPFCVVASGEFGPICDGSIDISTR